MSSDDASGSDADKRRHDRKGVVLRVDYDGAEDLLADYTDNLSDGGTFVVTSRELPIGTEIRLVLSFPGLLQPFELGRARVGEVEFFIVQHVEHQNIVSTLAQQLQSLEQAVAVGEQVGHQGDDAPIRTLVRHAPQQ